MITHKNQPLVDLTNRKLMTLFVVVFWTGALTLVALALGAFIAVIYLINLVLDAITELVVHLSSLYNHTDSLGKILLLIVGLYLVAKLAPWAARSLRKSYQSVRTALGW
jgi:hypothetical protein